MPPCVYQLVAKTSPKHRQNIAKTSPKHRQNIAKWMKMANSWYSQQ
jgi:hypothetical protein